MNRSSMLTIIIVLVSIIIIAGIYLYISQTDEEKKSDPYEEYTQQGYQIIQKNYSFSKPIIRTNDGYTNVYLPESDLNDVHDQWPVLPVNITTYKFPLGTIIKEIIVTIDPVQNITIPSMLSYGSCSTVTNESTTIYQSDSPYPGEHVRYHTGGGKYHGEFTTFLTIRIYPLKYIPTEHMIQSIGNVTTTIIYKEPNESLIPSTDVYDLLIICPSQFQNPLQKLVEHKKHQNIKTKIATIDDILETMKGRDTQEKMKYYIKQEIEQSGIEYVLLVGGIDGQSTQWNLPIRYSHVLIREGTQEMIEPSFISDLYFADIYDAQGNFSSWDSNDNGIYAEYDNGPIDEMDLYPDVALGRLPCRDKREVRIIVDKIIAYETQTVDDDWFKNIILISGDHWADKDNINEGVLIMDEAAHIMRDFKPVKLYATEEQRFYIRDITQSINKGAGFAYFCGHGSSHVWGIHNPPEATGWSPTFGSLGLIKFYKTQDMNFLRNKNKLPVTMVGGCFNGQYDVSRMNALKQGKVQWFKHCWAWHLTIQKRGGSIATIANTGLGTHAMGDADNNQINDYLEVYDGWLELKFFELYNKEHVNVIGKTQMDAITHYLNVFRGAHDEMDIKMVQQWQLFGDPSLHIGGIE